MKWRTRKAKRTAVTNRARLVANTPSPLRIDPTRTGALRDALCRDLNRALTRAFSGLYPVGVANYDPNQPRDEDGKWIETGAVGFNQYPQAANPRYKNAPKASVTGTDVGSVWDRLRKQGRLIEKNGYKYVELYHVTTTDSSDSIAKHGLVPGASEASGQNFKAVHAKYAVYFHSSKEAARDNLENSDPGTAVLVKALVPISHTTLTRMLPDEDASKDPNDGMGVLLEGGPVAFTGGVPRSAVKVLAPKGGKPVTLNFDPNQPRAKDGKWSRFKGTVAAKIPPGLRRTARLAARAYFSTFIMGNKAAIAVARAKGVDEAKLEKLGKRLMALDLATGGSRAAALAAALGAGGLALPAGMVPWFSVGYLAYSTLTRPDATALAAGRGVGRAGRFVGRGLRGLLSRTADAMLKRRWPGLLDEPTGNVFCPTGEGGGIDPTCSPGGGHEYYHGTADENVESIRSEGFRVQAGVWGTGVYLSSDRPTADAYAKRRGGASVLTLDVRSKKTLTLDLRGSPEDWEKDPAFKEWIRLGGDTKGEEGRQNLLKTGYDVVKVKFGTTDYTVVLDPSIIKVKDLTGNSVSDTDPVTASLSSIDWGRRIGAAYLAGVARGYDDGTAQRAAAGLLGEGDRAHGRKLVTANAAADTARIKELVNTSLRHMRGVTSRSARLVRETVRAGVGIGLSPRRIAADLARIEGMTRARAMTIARTETIRAHAEGQLDAMAAVGVKTLRVNVEAESTPDGRRCRRCARLDGRVFTVESARGIIPQHPNCRCAWMPAVGRKASPNPRRYTANVFCATGEGGGIDPTCKRTKGKAKKTRPQDLPPNPLPRVDADTELKMENALQAAAGEDSVKEFIGYSHTVERVPIALLSSPQTVKDVDAVAYFKKNPDKIEVTDPLPLVIQFGDKLIVRDGNSRTVAAQEEGRETIKARLVYVPEFTANVFCPTGKGGGRDPTCSPGGKTGPNTRLRTRLKLGPDGGGYAGGAKPKVAGIDYQHKDPDHEVVRQMKADPELNAKVKEYHDWAQTRRALSDKAHKADELSALAGAVYIEALTNGTLKEQVRAGKKFTKAQKEADAEWDKVREATGGDTPRTKFLKVFGVKDPTTFAAIFTNDLPLGLGVINPVADAEEFVGRLTGSWGADQKAYRVGPAANERAHYQDFATPYITLNPGAAESHIQSTHVHELGHFVEHRKPGVQQRVLDFLEYRAGGEEVKSINEGAGVTYYEAHERGRKDSFDRAFSGASAWYVGKHYPQRTTEIVSMGIQQLHYDPAAFVRKDPEYFHFLMSILK